MIVGGIFGGISSLFNNKVGNRGSFIIYDNDALTATTSLERANYKLLSFDGFIRLNYNNNVVIPQQSLENRDFSNDSIIDNPFKLSITAIISQQIGSINDAYKDSAGNIVSTIDNIGKSNTLVAIFRTSPMFNSYPNMHLEDWSYEQTPDKIYLSINLNFREIRTNYTPNDDIDQTSIDGVNNNDSFSPDKSNNPGNNTTKDNGIINSTTPTGNTSSLQPSSGKVLD
jgi:hypothetical protein